MTRRSKPPFRADHVGSLFRPPELIEMRGRHQEGEVSDAELRTFEDDCIRDIVKLQEDVGLEAVTDGELRRGVFHSEFLKKIRGVEFHMIEGREQPSKDRARKRTLPPFTAFIAERMERPAEGIEVENFRFLSAVTKNTAKLTIPSPTMTHFRGGRDAIDKTAYPDLDDFFADLIRIYNEEITALGEAGCRYIQLDDTNLAYLCDEQMRDGVREMGEDPDELPRTYAALINDAIRSRPDGMSICIHLCRGNSGSSWYAEGGYEPVAEALFNLTEVDGFFLEYDDERSGNFAPLRFVPKDKLVVLGLISSKTGKMEDPDVLKRRIEDASKYMPVEQMCLSPQCGFSSSTRGANDLTVDEEIAKLKLVVDVANDVWG